MATNVVSSAIVLEVLREDNYANWSVCVKNYLLAQDLWDIVEDNTVPPEPHEGRYRHWRKTNARALHAIQISCGPEILSQIRENDSAKSSWNTLATIYGATLRVNLDVERFDPSGMDNVQRFFHCVDGDEWLMANKIRKDEPTVISSTSRSGRTALHIAVIAGHLGIVEKLVKLMPKETLEMRDIDGNTALALAANLTEKTNMAVCMVLRNPELVTIEDKKLLIPVVLASARGHKNMTRYLYTNTPLEILKQNGGRNGALLLTKCITSKLFDVAWHLLKNYEDLPIAFDFDAVRPCYALAQAQLSSAFPRRGLLESWEINQTHMIDEKKLTHLQAVPEINQTHMIDEKKLTHPQAVPGINQTYMMDTKQLTHPRACDILDQICKKMLKLDEQMLKKASVYEAMLEAVKYGNALFIKKMTEAKPDLFWVVDEFSRGIFSYAIIYRREEIFNLIYDLKGKKEKITSQKDIFDNNMLHLAGMLPPSPELDRKSGAALQMQRELQWFKAVESIVHPNCKEDKNVDGKKPSELFAKNHEDLLKEGEKWAKDTATSFTVVGTLIITTVFAAAFIVPGGSDQNTGIPFYLHKTLFTIFIVSDALSLSASSTSVLMFLGIIISRYAAEDFLKTLPNKLLLGLFSLFFSILTMMIAFVTAVSIMIRKDSEIVILAVVFAGAPVIIFIILQVRLFREIFSSTYWSTLSANGKKKIWYKRFYHYVMIC